MSETRAKKRARGPPPPPVAAVPPHDLKDQLTASLLHKDLKGTHALLSSFPLFPAADHPSPLLLLEQPGASRFFDPSYSDRALAGLSFERALRLLAARDPCCELCGAVLHAPSMDCRDLFGVFAHAKCFEERLGNMQGLGEEGSKVEAGGAPFITRKGVTDKYKYHFEGMSYGRKNWDKELVSSTPWERHYAWVGRHALVDDAITVEGLAALPLSQCAGAGEALRGREGAAAALIRQALAALHPQLPAAPDAAVAAGAAGQ